VINRPSALAGLAVSEASDMAGRFQWPNQSPPRPIILREGVGLPAGETLRTPPPAWRGRGRPSTVRQSSRFRRHLPGPWPRARWRWVTTRAGAVPEASKTRGMAASPILKTRGCRPNSPRGQAGIGGSPWRQPEVSGGHERDGQRPFMAAAPRRATMSSMMALFRRLAFGGLSPIFYRSFSSLVFRKNE
jgi:hypothetical protein